MFAAPSDQPLPRLGNPRKFAQQGVRLSGQVPLSALERLGEALVTNEGQAEVALAFGISEERSWLFGVGSVPNWCLPVSVVWARLLCPLTPTSRWRLCPTRRQPRICLASWTRGW